MQSISQSASLTEMSLHSDSTIAIVRSKTELDNTSIKDILIIIMILWLHKYQQSIPTEDTGIMTTLS